VVTEKEYIVRCPSPEWIECLEMMPSLCQQVNCWNCGIPWVNCAVLCVKDDWKEQFWHLRYCLSKLRSLVSFSFSYDVTSTLAQFKWECMLPFNNIYISSNFSACSQISSFGLPRVILSCVLTGRGRPAFTS